MKMSREEMKTLELEYVEKDGLYYPLLSFDSVESEADLVGVGKYGTLWLEQMREHYPYQYKLMRLGGELRQAALQVNKEMYDCIEQIEEEQFRKHYTNESRGFMETLRLRNQIRMMAEESAIEEIIKCSQKL